MSTMVFDTSVLSQFARADLMSVLERITSSNRRVVTRSVLDEIRNGISNGFPELERVLEADWLQEVRVDSLQELILFAEYSKRFGTSGRDVGEASTMAWAKVNEAIVISDDMVAYNLSGEMKIKFQRSMGLLGAAINGGLLSESEAVDAVNMLLEKGTRLPVHSGAEFLDWLHKKI